MKSLFLAFALLPMLAHAQADSIAPDATNMSTLTATNFAKGIGIGWNVGNSLESTGGETNWGNPRITQQLIDSVKAAGFNAIRLPVAWSQFSNSATWTIKTAWLDRVEEVVNYAIKRDMYVVMNEHWDGGWLQPTNAANDSATKRLTAIWKQVAIRFRDYGDHLIFAGTNEVMKDGDYGTPTTEYVNVQNGYNQTFVKTVRATGGRNTYRYLVVQGFNTNIAHAVSFLKIPTDPTKNRLMVEVHYYDPYDFTLNEGNSTISQWGATATSSAKTAGWGDEAYADQTLGTMKTNFGDKGYPVIIGEYGAILKNVSESGQYRLAWNKYITEAAVKRNIVPFYWDNGGTGTNGLGLFNRSSGAKVYSDIIKAITAAAPSTTVQTRRVESHLSLLNERLVAPDARPIQLFDLHGRLVRTSSLVDGRSVLDIGNLGAGVHIARHGNQSTSLVAR